MTPVGGDMKKFVIALALVADIACAQAQQPQSKAPTPTKADAEKVVQMISADKVKTQNYCEIANLSDQINEAEQKKDQKKLDELINKADGLVSQMGPQYAALMDGMQALDQNSKEGEELIAVFEGLDKLCQKQ
jgi:ABC-type transporter Mla subunit MlaD